MGFAIFAGPRYNESIKVNPMRKILSEANKAYLAAFLDADGAIMACIEKHDEKKFGFRVRVFIKISQNDRKILEWFRSITELGTITRNRKQHVWRVRDQKEVKNLLEILSPYLKVKRKQAELAKKILSIEVKSLSKLIKVAQLADSLSRFNIRSKGRRKNFATMIQESISPND